ncbi:MAG: cysteine desulfurase [Fimbriimonadaceae bacterium]|nr:MAG: cysteine desulfurase [Fimbriimonadaceae bacterium]
MDRIYLDHAATTPLLPEVREAMLPWLSDGFGNPSSLHSEGRRARAAVDQSREILSELLGCLFGEIVFTSCGTEAANLGVIGGALSARDQFGGYEVILAAAEHHCVLHTQPFLERLGFKVLIAPVDREAKVDMNWLDDHIRPRTALVSVMHANNELGTLNPIDEIGKMCRREKMFFHIDAVQTFPDTWRVDDFEADLLTISAHKFYGPKGVGLLYARSGVKPTPLIVGGGQEREVRAGTENVAGIVGAGAAAQIVAGWGDWRSQVAECRDAFESELGDEFVASVKHSERLAGHSHVRYPGVDAETALIRLDREGISASSGAACSSGSLEPSHVLAACGYTEEESKEGLRFTFGKTNTVEQAKHAGKIVRETLAEISSRRKVH